jgi:hypothetical protein
MRFDLTRPCPDCPFREDITFALAPARTEEILMALLVCDQTFTCHATIEYDGTDEDGNVLATGQEQHCAGAMILAERLERPNQLMRIAERLGRYDRSKLQMNAPVFATAQAMRERMEALAVHPQKGHAV